MWRCVFDLLALPVKRLRFNHPNLLVLSNKVRSPSNSMVQYTYVPFINQPRKRKLSLGAKFCASLPRLNTINYHSGTGLYWFYFIFIFSLQHRSMVQNKTFKNYACKERRILNALKITIMIDVIRKDRSFICTKDTTRLLAILAWTGLRPCG